MKSPKSSTKPSKPKALLLRRVIGKSMQPSLRPGQLVVASGLFRTLEPEAVVIVRHDNLDKIKRIRNIKAGRIFVVGDNLRASLDSRSFGWINEESVIGKVVWPRT